MPSKEPKARQDLGIGLGSCCSKCAVNIHPTNNSTLGAMEPFSQNAAAAPIAAKHCFAVDLKTILGSGLCKVAATSHLHTGGKSGIDFDQSRANCAPVPRASEKTHKQTSTFYIYHSPYFQLGIRKGLGWDSPPALMSPLWQLAHTGKIRVSTITT